MHVDTVHEPIRMGGQNGAEALPETGELGANGHHVVAVTEQRHTQ